MKFTLRGNRILSGLLALTTAFTLASSAFAAFSDVGDGYWAREYIDSLSQKGYFSGYEDGSFRPGGQITNCETLVLLSRFYALDDDTAALIRGDFSSKVDSTVPPSLSWAKNELCTCLAAGIITESELSSVDLSAPVDKQHFALYLVRALRLSGDLADAANVTLPFEDTEQLTGDFRGSVAILYDAKIVDGDESNRFNPTQTVTRAVASAMLYRTLSFIDSEELELAIPEYKNASVCEGVIRSVGASNMRIELTNGLQLELKTASSAKISVNGESAALTTAYVGSYARVYYKDGAVTSCSISYDSNTQYVSGSVYSSSDYSTGSVNVVPIGSVRDTRYSLAAKAPITLDGKACSVNDLKKNYHVVLKLVDGSAAEVTATDYSLTLGGTIADISYGTTVELRLKDSDGAIWYFGFDISSLPDIYMGSYEISVDRLGVGDSVSVDIKNGIVSKIVSAAAETSVSGTITSVIESVSGIWWEIAADDGSSSRYLLADNVTVYKGKTSVLLSSVKAGSKITATVFNSTITSVNIESEEAATQTGKLYYVNALTSAPICNAATGKALGVSQITPYSEIVAYGSFENSTTLNATLIVAETLAS